MGKLIVGLLLLFILGTCFGSKSSSSGGSYSSGSSSSLKCLKCNSSVGSTGYYTMSGEVFSTSKYTLKSYCSRSCARSTITKRWR